MVTSVAAALNFVLNRYFGMKKRIFGIVAIILFMVLWMAWFICTSRAVYKEYESMEIVYEQEEKE